MKLDITLLCLLKIYFNQIVLVAIICNKKQMFTEMSSISTSYTKMKLCRLTCYQLLAP